MWPAKDYDGPRRNFLQSAREGETKIGVPYVIAETDHARRAFRVDGRGKRFGIFE